MVTLLVNLLISFTDSGGEGSGASARQVGKKEIT